jgi:Glycosyltransferase 61
MQQVFRCWSWWQSHPNKHPVLLWNQTHFNNKFTNAFMSVLEQYYDLRIIRTYNDIYVRQSVRSKDTGLYPDDIEITDYAMLLPQHAHALRELFQMYIKKVSRTIGENGQLKPSGCSTEKRIPRITILNRSTKSRRNFVNSHELQRMIEMKYPEVEVELVYFENIPMYLQMKYMMETDILISPHGAGLQNIIFMPNYQECSSMIEFLPPFYIVPDFFASLAKAASIKHSFFYMKQSDEEVVAGWDAHKYHHLVTYEHRDDPQCLHLPKVMDAVQTLINEWIECCNVKLSNEPYGG